MRAVRFARAQLPVLAALAWVGIAIAWGKENELSRHLAGSLAEGGAAVPLFITLCALAIVLSIPRFRNVVSVAAAGGFLIACGLVLAYVYGGVNIVFMALGSSLMWAAHHTLEEA